MSRYTLVSNEIYTSLIERCNERLEGVPGTMMVLQVEIVLRSCRVEAGAGYERVHDR